MIAILGATGHVGGKIAALLAGKHEPLRVIGRSADRLRPLVTKDVTAFAGDVQDTEFLVKAFTGADAVFALIPPNPVAPDFLRYADTVGQSIAKAIEIAKVKHAVFLSSVGAEVADRPTGPITGLHRTEERLNRVPGLNVVHLRAAYFMENLLMNIGLIKANGFAGSAVRGDLPIAMIATRDIAASAAERLVRRDFTGPTVRYLLGQRDVSLGEAAGIIGNRIGKPGLSYVQFPYNDAEKAMIGMGLSPDMSRTYVDMAKAFNEGAIKTEPRSASNTTPTRIETFVDEIFVPLYEQKKAA